MASLLQLLTHTRAKLDDTAGPRIAWQTDDTDCQWSNDQLTEALADAEDEAVRRLRGLRDVETVAITRIPIAQDVAEYDLDPRILAIDAVLIEETRQQLGKAKLDDLSASQADYLRFAEQKPLRWYLEDIDERKLRLYGTPRADDDALTLWLQVRRTPLERLCWIDADIANITAPEIPSRYHRDLVWWACHLALLDDKEDGRNLQLAGEYERKFERVFGPRPDGFTERWLTKEAGRIRHARGYFF